MTVRWLVLAAVLALAGQPAWAHSPYFTQIEKIDLPDGTQGELRLLHGDGIFLSDPVRVIAVDSRERLLARSEHGKVARIVCPAPRQCVAYLDRRILELAPAAEPGPVISTALHQHGSAERWELEASEKSFGFVTRRPSFGEQVAAYYGIAEGRPLLPSLHAVLGALSALVVAGLVIAPLRRGRGLWQVLGILAASVVVSPLALVSFYLMLLERLPVLLWIGSVGFGFTLTLALLKVCQRQLRAA